MGWVTTRKTGESITITDTQTGEKIVITTNIRTRFQYKIEIQASARFKIEKTEEMEKSP